ncbi:methyltransferase family protein [Tsuneonella amylolytica]|uniref:methyltransferase family protein n=1 Tax=Tsuneonella amylolytica TaxID=2338327 RepID=UPI000EAA3185|nr:isoprenylcysteine carboxylmethyltransferase family protein [Tsuneonella amylolytica]
MYQHELARSGKRLFFIRGTYIYTVIAIAVLIAYLTRDMGPFANEAGDRAWFWLSLAVASAGALIRVFTSGWAALGTSGRAKVAAEASELNTTGPYSLVRNPLYVGRIVNFTGLAMLSGSWVWGALVFLIATLIYERISTYEEEFLRGKFGEAHARWAESVPSLLPRLHGWVSPKYPFWWKRMIWREQNKLFLLATTVFLTWWARTGFDVAQLTGPWVTAYFALVVVRFIIGGLKMVGFFKELS